MTHKAYRSFRNQRARLAAALEPLERRMLLTAVVVNTLADVTDTPPSTVVSLRDAITIANKSTTPTTITFVPTVFATPKTITLSGHDLELSAKQPVTITGPDTGLTVSGNGEDLVFLIDKGVTAMMSNLTITGGDGYAEGAVNVVGGAIENNGTLTLLAVNVTSSGIQNAEIGAGGIDNTGTLTMTYGTVGNNTGGLGVGSFSGGITNEAGATLKLTSVTLSGNSGSAAGGIYNLGTATLSAVTLSGNGATGFAFPEGGAPGDGGGIANYGKITLTNCTLANNSNGAPGGGIGNYGAMSLFDSTVSGNKGDGLFASSPAASNIVANTIIAGNEYAYGGPDVDGAVQSSGYNLIGNTEGSTGWKSTDLTGTAASPLNPDLGPLANNGGPTQTLLPMNGPVLGHGSIALLPPGTITDQRGLARVVNGKLDIGSFEAEGMAMVTGTVRVGNAGLANVQVYADLSNVGYYVSGDPSTTTNAAGGYTVTGLVPGAYIIRQTLPANYAQVTPSMDYGAHVTLSAGENLLGQNFVDESSVTALSSVTGVVFQDDNGSSFEEPHGTGIPGVQIYDDLKNVGYYVSGDPTTTTIDQGVFTLTGITAGNAIIRQVLPAGYVQVAPANGYGVHLTVSQGEQIPSVEFGDMPVAPAPATATGTVYDDINGSGMQDDHENGIPSVHVYDDVTNVGYYVSGDPTTMTNAGGAFILTGITAGNAIIRQVIPAGYVQTEPTGGLGHHVTLTAGEEIQIGNFGDELKATM